MLAPSGSELVALRRMPLLAGLDEAAFAALAAQATIVVLEAGAPVFEAGDPAECFYVVLEGRCELFEREREGEPAAALATVDVGQCVGERAFFVPGPRSCTARASAGTRLAALPLATLSLAEGDAYGPLVRELQAQLVAAVEGLEVRNARALEHQRRMSLFSITVITGLSTFMFVQDGLGALIHESRGTTIITLPIVGVMGLALLWLVRRLGLPWATYGLTTAGWRASLREGLLLAVPLVVAATVAKALFLAHSAAGSTGTALIDPFDTGGRGPVSAGMVAYFILVNLAYVAVVVPIQELIARGVLQGLLERLIASRHRTGLSIVVSNLAFAAFHVYWSLATAAMTLLLGLALGWLYARTRNLLGVCVAHAVVGVWSLTIVRLQPMLS